MARVADILSRKGAAVFTVPPDATVIQAVELMVRHNIGAVVVLDGARVAGIFSERDFLNRVALPGLPADRTRIDAVLTGDLITVDPDRTVEECMGIMTRSRIRHLPVLDRGRLAGMVSIGDLVKRVSEEREVEVQQLTEYISGRITH